MRECVTNKSDSDIFYNYDLWVRIISEMQNFDTLGLELYDNVKDFFIEILSQNVILSMKPGSLSICMFLGSEIFQYLNSESDV